MYKLLFEIRINYFGLVKFIPPLGIQAPVIKEAESEAMNAITDATSSTSP